MKTLRLSFAMGLGLLGCSEDEAPPTDPVSGPRSIAIEVVGMQGSTLVDVHVFVSAPDGALVASFREEELPPRLEVDDGYLVSVAHAPYEQAVIVESRRVVPGVEAMRFRDDGSGGVACDRLDDVSVRFTNPPDEPVTVAFVAGGHGEATGLVSSETPLTVPTNFCGETSVVRGYAVQQAGYPARLTAVDAFSEVPVDDLAITLVPVEREDVSLRFEGLSSGPNVEHLVEAHTTLGERRLEELVLSNSALEGSFDATVPATSTEGLTLRVMLLEQEWKEEGCIQRVLLRNGAPQSALFDARALAPLELEGTSWVVGDGELGEVSVSFEAGLDGDRTFHWMLREDASELGYPVALPELPNGVPAPVGGLADERGVFHIDRGLDYATSVRVDPGFVEQRLWASTKTGCVDF
jgi:hypothetical protein